MLALIVSNSFTKIMKMRIKDGTRRNILSVYSSIFDPLGLIQPFILKPKLLIQDLSRLKCGWDDKIPDKVDNE